MKIFTAVPLLPYNRTAELIEQIMDSKPVTVAKYVMQDLSQTERVYCYNNTPSVYIIHLITLLHIKSINQLYQFKHYFTALPESMNRTACISVVCYAKITDHML